MASPWDIFASTHYYQTASKNEIRLRAGEATAEAGLSLTKIGLSSRGMGIAAGSFLLFLTNFVGIVAVAILVFACNRYNHWKKALIALLLVVGLSALLFKPLEQALHRLYVKNRVVRLIVKLAHTRPDLISGKAKLESLNVTCRGERLLVSIEGFLPKEQLVDEAGTLNIEKRVNLVAEYLSEDLGEPAVVEFDFIPVEMLRVSSERSRTTNAEEEADKDNDQP